MLVLALILAVDCPTLPHPDWTVTEVTAYGAIADDGLDDTAAVQAAIEDRGTIMLPPGQLDIYGELHMKSDVALIGVAGSVMRMHGTTLHFLSVDDVALLDFEMVGDGPQWGGPTLISLHAQVYKMRMEGMTLRDAPHDAIHALRRCDRLCWINNTIDGAGDDGFNPGGGGDGEGTNEVLIEGNVIRNVGFDGIHVSIKSFDVTVNNNIIEDCGAGIGLVGCRDSIITNNTIINCDAGILDHDYALTPGMTVMNNTTDGVSVSARGRCAVIVDNAAPVVDAGAALAHGNQSIEGHRPGDITCDGVISPVDLLAVLGAWGKVEGLHRADVNGSGVVDIHDLLAMLPWMVSLEINN